VPDLDTPREAGDYSARVWLEDEEGNVGATATAPLPRDTTSAAAPQDLPVTSPGSARSSDGFDVHWRNIADNGSPITAVRYQVLDAAGIDTNKPSWEPETILIALRTYEREFGRPPAKQELEWPRRRPIPAHGPPPLRFLHRRAAGGGPRAPRAELEARRSSRPCASSTAGRPLAAALRLAGGV
jgi:hypothetical protein